MASRVYYSVAPKWFPKWARRIVNHIHVRIIIWPRRIEWHKCEPFEPSNEC